MKKCVAFLLLVIALTATVVPCCKADDCCSDKTQASSGSDTKKEGACSPFITCGACTGFTQTRVEIKLAEAVVENTVHFSKENSLILSAYSRSLLQPPRSV